jgi:hypothetical protein
MAKRNQGAVDKLFKIVGKGEFTARAAVEMLVDSGYKQAPNSVAMHFAIKRDPRFYIVKETKGGTIFRKVGRIF